MAKSDEEIAAIIEDILNDVDELLDMATCEETIDDVEYILEMVGLSLGVPYTSSLLKEAGLEETDG